MSEEGGVRTIGVPPQGVSNLRPGGSKPSQPPGKSQVVQDPKSVASDDQNGSAQPAAGGPTRANASFSVDDATKLVTIKIVDSETGEVIRQIPPRDYIELAAANGNPKGTLFDSRS